MAFDDSSDPHVSKVLRFIRGNFSGSYHEVNLAPFRADQGRSFKFQAARLLKKKQLTAFRKVGPSSRGWDSSFVNF